MVRTVFLNILKCVFIIWLSLQVIEGLFHVAAHKFGVLDSIYLLNHYTTGVILFGDRAQLAHHSLPKVMFMFICNVVIK